MVKEAVRLLADLMIHDLTIGRLLSPTDVTSSGYPAIGWETFYESKGYIRVMRNDEANLGVLPVNFVGFKIYMPLEDAEGNEMNIKEGYEIVQKVPFDFELDKELPRYRVIRVSKPYDHHYELECERRVATG